MKKHYDLIELINRCIFQRKANLHNENIGNGIYESIARKIHDEIRDSKIAMKQSDLNSVFGTVKQSALEEVCFFIHFISPIA